MNLCFIFVSCSVFFFCARLINYESHFSSPTLTIRVMTESCTLQYQFFIPLFITTFLTLETKKSTDIDWMGNWRTKGWQQKNWCESFDVSSFVLKRLNLDIQVEVEGPVYFFSVFYVGWIVIFDFDCWHVKLY